MGVKLSGVVVTGLSATPSAATPAADVAYILLVSSALLDTSGRYKYSSEIIVVVDKPKFVLTKPLTESTTLVDSAFVSAIKALADGFAMNDGSEAVDGAVYSFAKGISNVAFTSDAVAHSLSRLRQDQIALLDNAAKVLARPVTDTVGVVDDQTVSAIKGLADSAAFADSVATLLLYIRDFDDSASIAEAASLVFTPSQKADAVNVADASMVSFEKPAVEALSVADASAYAFSAAHLEFLGVADGNTLNFSLSRVESTSVTDVGIVSVQDYTVLGYFAEDYVGISQAF